jgi:hypothetical protein
MWLRRSDSGTISNWDHIATTQAAAAAAAAATVRIWESKNDWEGNSYGNPVILKNGKAGAVKLSFATDAVEQIEP